MLLSIARLDSAYATTSAPTPSGGSETAILVIGDQEFDIQYTINGGTLEERMTADPALKTLLVTISSTSDGNLTIGLPTEMIDADDEFSVLIDGQAANFTELDSTDDARVLQVEFENGSEEIEIAGTFIVPELAVWQFW